MQSLWNLPAVDCHPNRYRLIPCSRADRRTSLLSRTASTSIASLNTTADRFRFVKTAGRDYLAIAISYSKQFFLSPKSLLQNWQSFVLMMVYRRFLLYCHIVPSKSSSPQYFISAYGSRLLLLHPSMGLNRSTSDVVCFAAHVLPSIHLMVTCHLLE